MSRHYWRRVAWQRCANGQALSTYVTDQPGSEDHPAFTVRHLSGENSSMADIEPPYDADCPSCWLGYPHTVGAHHAALSADRGSNVERWA